MCNHFTDVCKYMQRRCFKDKQSAKIQQFCKRLQVLCTKHWHSHLLFLFSSLLYKLVFFHLSHINAKLKKSRAQKKTKFPTMRNPTHCQRLQHSIVYVAVNCQWQVTSCVVTSSIWNYLPLHATSAPFLQTFQKEVEAISVLPQRLSRCFALHRCDCFQLLPC